MNAVQYYQTLVLGIPHFKKTNKEKETLRKQSAMLENVVKLPMALVWLGPSRFQGTHKWGCKEKPVTRPPSHSSWFTNQSPHHDDQGVAKFVFISQKRGHAVAACTLALLSQQVLHNLPIANPIGESFLPPCKVEDPKGPFHTWAKGRDHVGVRALHSHPTVILVSL